MSSTVISSVNAASVDGSTQGSELCMDRDGIAMDVACDSVCFEDDEGVNEAVARLKTRYAYRFSMRLFDIAFSLFVLIAYSWLFLVIAIIKIDDSKGSVFFKQKRVAKDGCEFQMYKFRSVYVDAELRLNELRALNEKTGLVFKMSNDFRMIRVSHWLCGCGGARQVGHRNDSTFEGLVDLDLDYLDRASVAHGLKLVFGTVRTMVWGSLLEAFPPHASWVASHGA